MQEVEQAPETQQLQVAAPAEPAQGLADDAPPAPQAIAEVRCSAVHAVLQLAVQPQAGL